MKTWGFIGKINLSLSVCLALLALTACHPDEEDMRRRRPHVPEGEEATVSLKWTMPAMEENKFQLCAPVSDERTRRLEDLWVGIYNVKNGSCTANFLFDMKSESPAHTAQKLQNIKTKSGESYIVAAANVRNGYGVSELLLESGDTVRLSTLLQQADTWEKYKSISAVLPQPNGIRVDGAFVMAGSFLAGGANDLPAGAWSDADGNPEPVMIGTGMNADVGGYIHLRRLFAYNRVTVQAGRYIKMELQNWQVCNLPVMSYLQERKSENSADVSTYFESGKLPDYKGNYSHTPVAHVFEAGAKDGEYVFDFYQFENRHAGLKKNGDVGVAEYQDRDREWKDGTSGHNTGVYKSLCATPAEPKPGPAGKGVNTNNFATYIVIKANIAYYAENAGIEAKPVAHPDSAKPAGAVLRTGNVSYVVHLGYCEGPADKVGADSLARDFNVRRNNWYDYKVTINGLKNIGLEATSGTTEDERQPGAEGYVFDSKEVIELDAHYGVFNISLTNWQRTHLQWVLDVPYGDDRYQETYLDYPSGEPAELRQNQFYNWIRFKPAPSKDLLAVYREEGLSDAEADAALWTLEDFRNVKDHPGIDGNGVAEKETDLDVNDRSTVRWYTVFVNEYAYEDGPDETGTYNWKRYANKPDRVAYLNTELAESPDGESRYMTPDYTIIQHSIQTYYNIQVTPTSALGVERECETYGLNMRWSDAVKKPAGGWNRDNGRWNEWFYARNRNWYGTGGILAAPTTVNGHPYLQAAETPAITRQGENKPAGKYAVYRLNKLSGNVAGTKASFDPSDASNGFYEIMDACLNRNRDENGNGKLDPEELKWYLATSGKYLRIVLGRESLKAPLMQFGVQLYGTPSKGEASRHHYAASDYQMIWSEEGVSTSDMSEHFSADPYPWPWQVRCVRNMGVNFSVVLEDDPVPPAYRVDRTNHMVYFDYYDDASLRPAQSGTMTVHTVGDLKNRASRKLEYALDDCKNMSTPDVVGAWGTDASGTLQYCYEMERYWDWLSASYKYRYNKRDATKADIESNWTASVNANEICGQYTQYAGQVDKGTWRVPNQVELTVMLRLNLFNASGVHWLSCTKEYYPMDKPTRFTSVRSSDGGIVTLGGVAPFRVRCVRDVD